MRDGQVVDADHDDRVQDDHLTQKHDFLLGTLATEYMPTIRRLRINFVVLLLRRTTIMMTEDTDRVLCNRKKQRVSILIGNHVYDVNVLASIQLLNDSG